MSPRDAGVASEIGGGALRDTCAAFGLAAVVCAVAHLVLWMQRPRVLDEERRHEAASTMAAGQLSSRLQWLYLPAFLAGSFADWLMGPYVYALYLERGCVLADIGLLFVVGYGSSMVFGTLAGSLCDRYGRKQSCLLYCVIMALACVLKNANSFHVLVAGRCAGGVATSLLFSAFESWAVAEVTRAALPASQLSRIVSRATFFNALGAITAGLVAEPVAQRYGAVGPFNIALFPLLLCAVLVTMCWGENYGSVTNTTLENLQQGGRVILRNRNVRSLAIMAVAFETAMYIFIFVWSPMMQHALQSATDQPPYGFIFATFMVWKMTGTAVYDLCARRISTEAIMAGLLLVSGGALLIPLWWPSFPATLQAFCLFEMCIGLYWPAIYVLRAKYVDDSIRATTINLFRLPMNFLVASVLWNAGNLPLTSMLKGCAGALLLGSAAVSQFSPTRPPMASGL